MREKARDNARAVAVIWDMHVFINQLIECEISFKLYSTVDASTFVYDIATVKYRGWIFYDRAPTTYSFSDRSKKWFIQLLLNLN